jgi:hypothetical protein
MTTIKTTQDIDPRLMGAVAHYKGQDIVFAADSWKVKTYTGNECFSRAVFAAIDGILKVHLVQDFDVNGNKVYCNLPLGAGLDVLAIFDEVIETGSTAELFDNGNLIIWY